MERPEISTFGLQEVDAMDSWSWSRPVGSMGLVCTDRRRRFKMRAFIDGERDWIPQFSLWFAALYFTFRVLT